MYRSCFMLRIKSFFWDSSAFPCFRLQQKKKVKICHPNNLKEVTWCLRCHLNARRLGSLQILNLWWVLSSLTYQPYRPVIDQTTLRSCQQVRIQLSTGLRIAIHYLVAVFIGRGFTCREADMILQMRLLSPWRFIKVLVGAGYVIRRLNIVKDSSTLLSCTRKLTRSEKRQQTNNL